MIVKVLKRILYTKEERLRQLIKREAEYGARLFPSDTPGVHRNFFYSGENTWVWVESQENGKATQHNITRYEIRPDRIIKIQNGQYFDRVSLHEAQNLARAVDLYYRMVLPNVYGVTV